VPASKSANSSSSSSASATSAATSAAKTPLEKAHTFTISLLRDLKNIENRAFAVIDSTSRGKELSSVLKRLLYREGSWLQWKASSCPAFERKPIAITPPPSLLPILNANASSSSSSSSSSLSSSSSSSSSSKKQAVAELPSYNFGKTFDEAVTNARGLAEQIPSYASHIELYLDAEDPEAGIDDEYHPKHDVLYSWRARRLMAAQALPAFAFMKDGNISNGLAFINKDGARGGSHDIYSLIGVPKLAPVKIEVKKEEEAKPMEVEGEEETRGETKSDEVEEKAEAEGCEEETVEDAAEMAVDEAKGENAEEDAEEGEA